MAAGCAAAGCAAVVALAAACRGASPVADAPAPAASAAAVAAQAARPVDHLAPDELLEGTDKAFDVTLPRGLRIDGAFSDDILTSGPFAVHPLAEYFRAHLQGGDLREGSVSATFDHVTAPGKDRPLSVHITKVFDSARVEIQDVTPPPIPQLPDDAARWKRVGLTPSGRVLDPTHLD